MTSEQTIELAPNESKLIAFEAIPHEAKTYHVSVNGLTGSFRAIAAPKAVEITKIALDKTSLLDWDEFTISITFSNPHEYDVWVRPQFGFGNLIGEEFNIVPALMGISWEDGIEPGGSGAEWVDLSIVAIKGSNMTNYVYDPEGCALVTGEYAYLKVPAKGKATTSKKWTVATYHERRGSGGLLKSGSMFWWENPYGYVWEFHNLCIPGNEYVVEYFAGKEYADDAWEVYEPIPRIWDVCVKVEGAFAVIYHPEGVGICHYGLPEAVGKTRHYERVAYTPLPIVGVAKDLVSVGVEYADWQDDRGYWHRYRWQRCIGTSDVYPYQPIFEDASPPDWW